MVDDSKLLEDMGTDAQKWAKQFMVRFSKREDTIDEGLMLVWFANAIEAGRNSKRFREMVAVQGRDGNWDFDPYMRGMFNGMELMLAIAEDREPKYRSVPATYRHDGKTGLMSTREVSERLEAWLKSARDEYSDSKEEGPRAVWYSIDSLLDTTRDCAAEGKLPWEL